VIKKNILPVILIMTALFVFFSNSPAECNQTLFQDNYAYAVKLLNSGKYDAAALEFKSLLSKTDNMEWTSILLYMTGQSYYKLGNFRESKIYLERVVKNYPKFKFLIFVKEMLNDINQKIPDAETIDKSPSDKDAGKTSARIPAKTESIIINNQTQTIEKEDKSQTDLNSEELSKIYKIDKLIKEGNDYFNNGNFEKALESYKNAYDLDEENSVTKFNLGVTRMKLGNYAEANALIEEVYKKNPEDAEALKYVAYTYLKLDKPVLSLIYWKRLIRISPNDEFAAANIKKIEQMVEMK